MVWYKLPAAETLNFQCETMSKSNYQMDTRIKAFITQQFSRYALFFLRIEFIYY